jgi:hypothetical protein
VFASLFEFADRPIGVALITIVAALCAIGLEHTWMTWRGLPWLAGLVISGALPAFAVHRNRLQQTARAAADAIKRVLAACGRAFGHPDRHVRVNIMFPTPKNPARRQVHAVTAFNMDRDPDRDLEIDSGAGVSGEAFFQHRAAWADLTLALAPGGPTWGLSDAEKAKVRGNLRSILSVPVLNPDDPDGTPFATLQVDSDEEIAATQFDKPERQNLAQAFADVVALLIQGSDPR